MSAMSERYQKSKNLVLPATHSTSDSFKSAETEGYVS